MDLPGQLHWGWRTAQWLIFLALLPMLLSWGLGAVHPWLDSASRVSALLALIPADSGLIGLVLVLLTAVGATLAGRLRSGVSAHIEGLSSLLGLLGALSLLCAALAMTRPLPWVAFAAAILAYRMSSLAASRAWRLSATWQHVGGVICWGLAARIRPYGEGLLDSSFEDALAAQLVALPSWAGEALLLLFVVGLAGLLWRRCRPAWTWALGGAAAAVLFEHVFGNLAGGMLSVAAIGALAGAWPARFERRGSALNPVLWLLVISLLCGLRLGFAERWDCGRLDADMGAHLIHPGAGFSGIAIVSDNMPFLLLLGEDGTKLTRLSPGGGGVSESRSLQPPGGVLVSPPGGTKVIGRLIQTEGGVLRVEWWDVFSLQLIAARELQVHCDPGLSFIEPGGARQWISCRDSGEVLIVDRRPEAPLTRWGLGAPVLGVQRLVGGVLIDHAGRDARAAIYDADGHGLAGLTLGPWSAGIVSVSEYAEAFAVSRGPAGHLEFRGRAPTVEYQYPLDLNTPEGALEALGSIWDTVRVGHWPGRPLWIEGQSSAYLASPIDARIWRVDLEVSWHQSSLAVGAPPLQVVLDSPSETLYGVNRCGVFEARIKSTFPWRDMPLPPPLPPTTPEPT